MKVKFILTSAFIAGTALCSFAQTHVEGVEYYKADQLQNAKELLLRNLNNAGTDKAISNYYLGMIALDEGDKAQATKYFEDGKQINPDYAFNYVGLGAVQLKSGDKKGAEELFKQAEKLVKKSPELDIAIARAYYDADPVAYAKEIDTRIAKARKNDKENKNAAIYIFEGDMKKDAKDFGAAGAKYQWAADNNPEDTEAYVKYANLFTKVNPQFAIDMLTKLLAQSPNSALAQRELANAYYNANQYAEAAQQYGKYVNNPNHFKQDEDRYAFLLFYGGNYKDGYDYSTKLLNANPNNFTAQRYQFMNAAQIKEMAPQLLPMAEALLQAHKANPNNKFAPIDYNLIASEYVAAKRPQDAQIIYEEAIKEMPDNADFYKQLAMVYVEENNLTKATEAYQGYLDHTEKPGYNDFIQQATFAFYAGVENKANDPAAADKYYAIAQDYANKAKEAYPTHYKPIKMSGDIAKQTAPEDQVASVAVPFYTEAITLLEGSENPSRYNSDAKEMYNYMGNYYLDQKDVQKAKEYFNKYLELDPNNDAYRKFVEGLN